MLVRRHRHRDAPKPDKMRLAEKRLLLRHGEHRDTMFADIQPNPDISQLTLPATLKMRPSWRSHVGATSFFLFFSFCMTSSSNAFPFIVYLIAYIVLGTLLNVSIAFSFNSWIVTEQGIEARSSTNRQFLAWSDITLFAIEPSSSSRTRSSFYCYSVSSKKFNMSVLHPKPNSSRYYYGDQPTISYDVYVQYFDGLISVIAARTRLPLYDLRKPYPKGDTHDDVSRERISHR